MATIFQKYEIYTTVRGVLIKRFYPSIDKSGNVANAEQMCGFNNQWEYTLNELFNKFPKTYLTDKFELEIWNMFAPDLPERLRDCDPVTPGDQNAAGICWSCPGTQGRQQIKRIAIGVFGDITNIEFSLRSLAHEYGHLVGGQFDLGNSGDLVSILITNEFDRLRTIVPVGQINNNDRAECWAELWRMFYGDSRVIGTFSDGKGFSDDAKKSPMMEQLQSLMKAAFPIWRTLNSSKYKNFAFKQDTIKVTQDIINYSSWYQWERCTGSYAPYWWYPWYTIETWQTEAMTPNGDLFQWVQDNGIWKWKYAGNN